LYKGGVVGTLIKKGSNLSNAASEDFDKRNRGRLLLHTIQKGEGVERVRRIPFGVQKNGLEGVHGRRTDAFGGAKKRGERGVKTKNRRSKLNSKGGMTKILR